MLFDESFWGFLGIIITIAGGTIGAVTTIINQKRSMVKEVKEHTSERIDSFQGLVETKLENIDYRITNNENILRELKTVNKEELVYMKRELATIQEEISALKEKGTPMAMIKMEDLRRRVELIEARLEVIMNKVDLNNKKAPI